MNNYPRRQEEREARGGFNLRRRSDLITPNPKLRLLDQVREVMRLVVRGNPG